MRNIIKRNHQYCPEHILQIIRFRLLLFASFDNSYLITKTTLYNEKTSIIDIFKENTAIGSILNENLEFEVADTIYKFSKSGYTIYAIEKAAYKNIKKYLAQEKSILNDIESYPKISFGKYQLEKGILLYYTGNPIIEVTRIPVPIPTRVAQDGRTKVQASFWKSRTVFKLHVEFKWRRGLEKM